MANNEIYFLSLEEVLYIHSAEINYVNHDSNIRDIKLIESAVENTKLIYEQCYVSNIFELASAYIRSIAMNHPFVDGNKRTALAAALIFLECNGYIIEEKFDEELADKVLDFINKKINQEDLAKYLENNSEKIFE